MLWKSVSPGTVLGLLPASSAAVIVWKAAPGTVCTFLRRSAGSGAQGFQQAPRGKLGHSWRPRVQENFLLTTRPKHLFLHLSRPDASQNLKVEKHHTSPRGQAHSLPRRLGACVLTPAEARRSRLLRESSTDELLN